jgi:hypothetical protein
MLLICTIAPDQRGRPEDLHIEERAQLRVGGLLQSADMAPSGVVDQHVDPAVPGQDIGDHPVDGLSVRHIESHRLDLVRMGGHHVVQGARAPGRGHHDVPGIRGGGGERPSEAAVGTGDQPYPAHLVSSLGRCRAARNQACPAVARPSTICRDGRRPAVVDRWPDRWSDR